MLEIGKHPRKIGSNSTKEVPHSFISVSKGIRNRKGRYYKIV